MSRTERDVGSKKRLSSAKSGRGRKVDVRLPGKGNSNSHGARPVHLIITMIKWIRTSRLSIQNSLSWRGWHLHGNLVVHVSDNLRLGPGNQNVHCRFAAGERRLHTERTRKSQKREGESERERGRERGIHREIQRERAIGTRL